MPLVMSSFEDHKLSANDRKLSKKGRILFAKDRKVHLKDPIYYAKTVDFTFQDRILTIELTVRAELWLTFSQKMHLSALFSRSYLPIC